MAKRRADKQLTDRNWNEEEEEVIEETKVFEKATDEVLAKRVIRKAKRTLSDDGERPKVNAFANFTFNQNGGTPLFKPPELNTPKTMSLTNNTTIATNGNKTSDEYLNKVAKLNQDILSCISKRLEEQKYLDLTPCFEDYFKHFQRITKEEEQRKNNNNILSTPLRTAPTPEATTPKQTFSFGVPATSAAKTTVFGGSESSSTFKFDATPISKTPEVPASKPPQFSFGVPPQPADGTQSGFVFGKVTSPSSEVKKQVCFSAGVETNFYTPDEDEHPPKVEIKPVEEEGSLYTKKVKLFYKKPKSDDGNPYAEKGIGFLHVKKLEDSHQLLVRAQTTLGNVLLNIRLGKDLPVSRVGKNNVGLMCIPNPPIDPKATTQEPVMFLIRVKTTEDADELKDKLLEFKGSS